MSGVDNEFAELMGRLEYSMIIVTLASGQERSGCLVGFASQVSINPPRFLACLSVKNRTYRLSQDASIFMVHLVGEAQEELAGLFGGQTGDELDKFAHCQWVDGPGGAPALVELESRFAGRVLERVPFGDHVGFVLEPIEVHLGEHDPPLNFHQANWIEPGHEP